MERYNVIEAIGEGSFGRVYKAEVLKTKEIVAFKIISKKGRAAKELLGLKREYEIQKTLNHPNIILMLDSFETKDDIVVISEYMDKDLSELLKEQGRLPEQRACQIACNLISALHYLHSHRILHRDLKPQNVLLNKEGLAKLCDFGFARCMGARTHVLTSFKGTPLYMAPEVMNEKPYGHSADLWSLGCIIFELLVGAPPFCASSLLQLAYLIQYQNINWPDFFSPECRSFLEGLLHKEPEERFNWNAILEHQFLKKGDLMMHFENYGPEVQSKQPFTSNSSASEVKARETHRKEQNYGMRPFSNVTFPKQDKLMLDGACSTRPVKTSSCPTETVKMFSSINDNYNCKEALHSSLKRVHLDGEKEKKLYTSLASEIANVKISKDEQTENESFDESKLGSNKDSDKNRNACFKKSKTMFTLHSWDSAASVGPIENDEWLAFIERNMEELMTGQLECLRNHNLVSVVVAPLRNPNASCRVLEHVANMLSLPFVVDGPSEKDLESIKQVYLEIKVIPNLVYASKIVARSKGYDSESSSTNVPIGSEMLLRPVSELSAEELQSLVSIYLLICHLVHSGDDFLTQFCDAAAILNAVSLLQQFLLLGRRKVRIVTDLLAILNLILRDVPENADLVEQIVLKPTVSGGNVVDLSILLTHPSHIIRSRTCDLIKLLGITKPKSLQAVLNPKFYQNLNALLSDSSTSVRMAAEEVLKEIKSFAALKTG